MTYPHLAGLASLGDTAHFPSRMTITCGWAMRWMRRRSDRVMITNGKYVGHDGTVESNVYEDVLFCKVDLEPLAIARHFPGMLICSPYV